MTTPYDDIEFSESDVPRKAAELHPRGSCKAVCVDVIDLGEQENTFKKNDDGTPMMQHKIRIVWETSRARSDGKRFTISKSYTMSLYDGSRGGQPAKLYTHMSSWMGDTWDGRFSAKRIVGQRAELFIEHEKGKQDKTKTFAKVLAVHPLEGEEFNATGSYKRFVAKGQNEAPSVGYAPDERHDRNNAADDDDGVPF